ncbi:MAG TPA: transporter [Bacteroidota bacterium]|nr:transporter [Bacteroidota bacterium]
MSGNTSSRKGRTLKLAYVFLSLSLGINIVYASCGASTCPLNNYHAFRAGFLTLSLSHEYINQNRLYYGSSLSSVGAIPEDHDEIQTINDRTEFNADYGVSDRFAFGFTLPYIHREHTHLSHEETPAVPESWNFSGLGDIVLKSQFVLLMPDQEFEPYLGVSVGLKLPTGATGSKNNDGEEAEVTIQPGTGSTDVIFSLNYRQTLASVPTFNNQYSALPLIIGLGYQASGTGKDDYRFGNTLHVHVGTSYELFSAVSLLFQVNGRFQEFADVGMTDEPRDNTGGSWIYASPGLSLQLGDDIAAHGYVQLPMYQDVHGLQQTSALNLQFGISFSPNLFNQ